MDRDISTIMRILKKRGRIEFANMFRKSRGQLNESSTYGSMAFSRLTTYEFYQPIDETEVLKSEITEFHFDELLEILRIIYPVKADAPEIVSVAFYVDPDRPLDDSLVEVNELSNIDFEYIDEQISKCREKIGLEDYEGSITNARTLIESVCMTIAEFYDNDYMYDGNLMKLYKLVSMHLKMDPKDYEDGNLKQILSGIFSLINGIAGLRNTASDSHGKSPNKRYKIDKRHALLAVNISKTASEYLYMTWQRKKDINLI